MNPPNTKSPAKSRGRKKKPVRSPSFSTPALLFPLSSFLHPLRTASSQWLVLPALLSVAFLFRWAVGLGPYSGLGSEPMHGDFEAQRHWIELTTHVPTKEWYWHDLEWWGLDYPPLTAYHSWVMGIVGKLINPSWFTLYESRGLDDDGLKTFMRATVVASEYLTYIPSVVIFARVYGGQAGMSKYQQAVALAAILMHPGLIIIDHGHFQYNSVMLGLAIAAVDCFLTDHLLWGSFFFVLSLGFKQMALYYAPAIFAYLLGLCIFPRIDIKRLGLLGVVVIATFAALFAPLVVFGGPEQIMQSVHRIFPFARGLWEDKVANFWCAGNVFFRFKARVEPVLLQRLSLLATLTAITPPCVLLFLNPRKQLLPLGLSACAWGFFLFSFQVHEKSVLLPLIPLTTFLAGSLDADVISWITWMNNISMFSMYPLLRRDGLTLQYVVVSLLYAWLMGTFERLPNHWFGKVVHVGSYLAVGAIHVADLYIGPTQKYPDIWVVVNVLVCFGAYGVSWFWVLWKLFDESSKSASASKPKKE